MSTENERLIRTITEKENKLRNQESLQNRIKYVIEENEGLKIINEAQKITISDLRINNENLKANIKEIEATYNINSLESNLIQNDPSKLKKKIVNFDIRDDHNSKKIEQLDLEKRQISKELEKLQSEHEKMLEKDQKLTEKQEISENNAKNLLEQLEDSTKAREILQLENNELMSKIKRLTNEMETFKTDANSIRYDFEAWKNNFLSENNDNINILNQEIS